MPSRRPLLVLVAMTAALFVLAACGSDDDAQIAADDPGTSGDAAGGDTTRPWIAGDWELQAASGDDGPVTLPDAGPLGLSIAGPDSISGDAGCNTFGGRIDAPFDGDAAAGSLSITEMFWTEMACEHLDFEVVYLDLLTRVDEWELTAPSGLVFRGDGVELTYGLAEAGPELTLEGPTWVFDTIYDGEGVERTASSTRSDKPEVTAIVAAGALTLTVDGCDPVEVAVAAEADGSEGSFIVGEPASLPSLVSCDDPDSNLVAAVDGVAEATSFQIVDRRLTLIGTPGETISFLAADG